MTLNKTDHFLAALSAAVLLVTRVATAASFEYDALNRLTRVDYDNGTSIAYTYDAAGNRLSLVAQAGIPGDRTPPVIQITEPTTERLYVTTANSITLGGTASDATGIAALSCTNDSGAQGSVAGTTTWTAGPIALSNGLNRLTVSASDPTGNVGRASLLVVALPPDTIAQTLFADDFNDNAIADTWNASGNVVQETAQTMQLSATVQDLGGVLVSDPIPINRTGLVTITRRARLHYGNQYFVGSFKIAAGTLNPFGVYYANMDYNAPPHYYACHGFYLGRDDQSPHEWVEQENDTVGPTAAIWDTWFDEKLTYDPVSGQLDYFVNGEHRLAFTVGALPAAGPATLTLHFNTAGWYTGHEHFMDDLIVAQADPVNDLFSDDFNDNAVAPAKWGTSGNAVAETGQVMQVETTIIQQPPGVLTSTPFAIARTGLISMSRRVFLHHDDSHGQYFYGCFRMRVTGLPEFGLAYDAYSYSDANNQPKYGFFIVRNGAAAHTPSQQADVSEAITPVWDAWFDERITYDPENGILDYYINGTRRMTFYVGAVPVSEAPTMSFFITADGWFTGHQQLFDDIHVTQIAGVTAVWNRDTDTDGMPDWAELLARTSISNSTSCLTLHGVAPSQSVPGGFVLEWASAEGVYYSVNRSTNLLVSPNPFIPIRTGIPGLPGTTTYTDPDPPPVGPAYYRIEVDF